MSRNFTNFFKFIFFQSLLHIFVQLVILIKLFIVKISKHSSFNFCLVLLYVQKIFGPGPKLFSSVPIFFDRFKTFRTNFNLLNFNFRTMFEIQAKTIWMGPKQFWIYRPKSIFLIGKVTMWGLLIKVVHVGCQLHQSYMHTDHAHTYLYYCLLDFLQPPVTQVGLDRRILDEH